MNAKQSRFVEEYLKDLNATQAAIRAGYSPDSAEVQGPRLLGNAGVAAAIAEGKKRKSRGAQLTQKRVLKELRALAFSNVTHYVIDDTGNVKLAEGAPDNAMAAISAIDKKITHLPDGGKLYEVKLKFWDKPGTLKLAGRHVDVKGFSDRTEITGKNGGPIQIAPMTVEQANREIEAIEAEANRRLEAKKAKTIDVETIEKPNGDAPTD